MAKPSVAEMKAKRLAKSAAIAAASKKAVMDMTGDKLLKITLANMADKQVKAAVRSGLSACVGEFAKGIRQQIPAPLKSFKKIVGSGVAKQSAKTQGAKAGFSVGRTSKIKANRSGKNVTATGKLKGVGIAARNIHWAALGTKRRTVKKTRMYVGGKLQDVTNWNSGKMPAIVADAVREGVQAKQAAGVAAMEKRVWKRLTADITKRKAK